MDGQLWLVPPTLHSERGTNAHLTACAIWKKSVSCVIFSIFCPSFSLGSHRQLVLALCLGWWGHSNVGIRTSHERRQLNNFTLS